jgi:hypothetical protein
MYLIEESSNPVWQITLYNPLVLNGCVGNDVISADFSIPYTP